MSYKRRIGIVSLILIATCFVGFLACNRISSSDSISKEPELKSDYVPTEYEQSLIEYFKVIALQSEYDDNPEKTIKWKQPMVLFVYKDFQFKTQMDAIRKTIDEINGLATDGFKITLTDNPLSCNAILYLCHERRVAALDHDFYELFSKDIDYKVAGLAYSEYDIKGIIHKSFIFISPEYHLNIQEANIKEEITQSLGLAFDSDKYPNSIFYKHKDKEKTIINEYSQLDKDIIRLLYHPKMKPGLDAEKLEVVIKEILASEKVKSDT